jgi:hypothetical protein
LSAVFHRLASDAPALPAASRPKLPVAPPPYAPLTVWGKGPQFHGFVGPEPAIAEAQAADPSVEDIVALLAEQPEVAPLIEVDLSPIDDARTALPAPAPPLSVPAPPEPPPVPSRPPVSVTRLGNRPGDGSAAPRVARPSVIRPAPPPPVRPPPPSPPPPLPQAPPPPEAAPHRPADLVRTVASPAPAMNRVGRQAPSRNRRLYRRVQLPAEIEINGTRCSLIDVSIGGFAVTGMTSTAANTIVPVTLRLTIDGIEVGTQVNARIVYANPTRSSGRFIDLTASQTAFLRYIVTWRGESVGTVGTTTLLDAITGGPDHGLPPGSAERFAPPRERWWSGLIGRRINPPR